MLTCWKYLILEWFYEVPCASIDANKLKGIITYSCIETCVYNFNKSFYKGQIHTWFPQPSTNSK